jgi:hypothetical protein
MLLKTGYRHCTNAQSGSSVSCRVAFSPIAQGYVHKWVSLSVRFVCSVRSVHLQTDNFRVFLSNIQTNDKLPFARSAYSKRKRKTHVCFHGWQTIHGNWRLLFQQTCPSMVKWSPAAAGYSTMFKSQLAQDHIQSRSTGSSVNMGNMIM